jgi:hypothetical protein
VNQQIQPRKILSIKKKIVSYRPDPITPPVIDYEKEANLAKQKAASEARQIAGALKQRLEVHLKSTKELKKAKHPIRIACLQKMIIRLDKYLSEINKLKVVYDDLGNQSTVVV